MKKKWKEERLLTALLSISLTWVKKLGKQKNRWATREGTQRKRGPGKKGDKIITYECLLIAKKSCDGPGEKGPYLPGITLGNGHVPNKKHAHK